MSKILREFLVQGSESEPYKVIFERDGSNLKGTCTCRAGIFGQLCKHRLSILGGATAGVVSNNTDQIGEVSSWLAGTNVAAAIADLTSLEAEKALIETRIKQAKKLVAQALTH